MPRQRLIRRAEPLAADTQVLRGHLLDEGLLRESAAANFELYGFYGLSVFYLTGGWSKDRILVEKLNGAPRVTVLTAGDLEAKDLRVLPTGAEPHGDIVGQLTSGLAGDEPGDLDALIASLLATRRRVEDNPHYRGAEEAP